MVVKRKVTKKKAPAASAGRKTTAAAARSAPQGAAKKKGVAVRRKPKTAPECLVLGESILISNVTDWRDKMVAVLAGREEIKIDGSAVEHIDGTGLQLLVALVKEAASNKTNIAWQSASDVLQHNAAQLGLTEALNLDKLS